jgi:four helix bundle protein
MSTSFRDLTVWKKSIDLTKKVYILTEEFPSAEKFGLSSQMRRAAVSVASNIAEGSARRSKKDFQHFVGMARGSNCELQTQLVIAAELGFGSQKLILEVENSSHEVGKMLSKLSDYLGAPASQPDSRTEN